MKCVKCGKEITTLKDFYSKCMCFECRSEYQKQYRDKNKSKLDKRALDYMQTKRWLNGSSSYSGELG